MRLRQAHLQRVVDRAAGVGQQDRLGDVEPEDRRARLEPNQGPGRIGQVVVDHAAQGRSSAKPNALPDPALALRRAALSGPFGTARRDVGVVEPLEDVVRRGRVVEVVPLVEGTRLQQIRPLLPDVAHLEDHVAPELALDAEVALLDRTVSAGRDRRRGTRTSRPCCRVSAAPSPGRSGSSEPSAPRVTFVPSRIW